MNGYGTVIETDGIMAKVLVQPATECLGCPSKSHCHGGETKPREINVINDFGAVVSDTVEFEADSWKMIVSASLLWLMPVAAMSVGYIVADRFAGGVVPIVSAFLFLGVSFAVLRGIDRLVTGGRTFYPRITGVVSAPTPGAAGHECGRG